MVGIGGHNPTCLPTPAPWDAINHVPTEIYHAVLLSRCIIAPTHIIFQLRLRASFRRNTSSLNLGNLGTGSTDFGDAFVGIGNELAVGWQLDISSMNHGVDLGEWRHIDLDIFGNVTSQAFDLKGLKQVQQDTTFIFDGRRFTDEMQLHFHRDAFVHADTEEIYMDDFTGTGIVLYMTNKGRLDVG